MSVDADPSGRGDSKVDVGAPGPAGGAVQLLLVPAPDVSAAIARELARELPARLDGRRWRVAVDDEELLPRTSAARRSGARSARAHRRRAGGVPDRCPAAHGQAAADRGAGRGPGHRRGVGARHRGRAAAPARQAHDRSGDRRAGRAGDAWGRRRDARADGRAAGQPSAGRRLRAPGGPRPRPAAGRDGARQPALASVQQSLQRRRGGAGHRRVRRAQLDHLAAQRRAEPAASARGHAHQHRRGHRLADRRAPPMGAPPEAAGRPRSGGSTTPPRCSPWRSRSSGATSSCSSCCSRCAGC